MSDDPEVAAKSPPPEGIAKNCNRFAFGASLLFAKFPPKLRLNAQQRQEIGRDAGHGQLQRLAPPGKVQIVIRPDRHRLERLGVVTYKFIADQICGAITGFICGLDGV